MIAATDEVLVPVRVRCTNHRRQPMLECSSCGRYALEVDLLVPLDELVHRVRSS